MDACHSRTHRSLRMLNDWTMLYPKKLVWTPTRVKGVAQRRENVLL
jgi:hypothetical protein